MHQESRTRDRVRRAVGEQGPVTASTLAKELGLTPAAVRRHLDALGTAGLIAEHVAPAGARRGRGRPARAYVLTELGQDQFRTAYDDVATAALHYLADSLGGEAVDSFAADQMSGLEERLRARVEEILAEQGTAPDDLDARAQALAVALSAEGYAASARPVGQGTGLAGIQLCQGHCPVRSVASEFRAFCDAETDVISRILGVHVQRLATLAAGKHVCTTFVPTGALGTGPPTDEERARARPYVIPRTTERTTDHPADERATR
ncbi:transcriptional regulator [Ornithinimicrobium humiphilum]|uniref:Putative ArsR family transcriptional regulator n=2 Tax=Ornithinimicrobium humiphilum TaxID=125288 RepID=A0A543KPF9_9MICO|nr:helix-turn-helix domain-containing protein [Ornithinimicrobium humiphilum]TQM96952.1 putative ArsR family transcriptional regulator [Ornithinimicrobium humiphilum]